MTFDEFFPIMVVQGNARYQQTLGFVDIPCCCNSSSLILIKELELPFSSFNSPEEFPYIFRQNDELINNFSLLHSPDPKVAFPILLFVSNKVN